jgi:hypothetical protein
LGRDLNGSVGLARNIDGEWIGWVIFTWSVKKLFNVFVFSPVGLVCVTLGLSNGYGGVFRVWFVVLCYRPPPRTLYSKKKTKKRGEKKKEEEPTIKRMIKNDKRILKER